MCCIYGAQEIFTISDSLKEEEEMEDEGGTQKQQLLKLAAIKRTWAGTVKSITTICP